MHVLWRIALVIFNLLMMTAVALADTRPAPGPWPGG